MQNFEESKFQAFEYDHSLNHEEVQHPVGTLLEMVDFTIVLLKLQRQFLTIIIANIIKCP